MTQEIDSSNFYNKLFLILLIFLVGLQVQAQSNLEPLSDAQLGTLNEQYERWFTLTEKYNFDQTDSAVWASNELIKVAVLTGNAEKIGTAYRISGIYLADAGLLDRAIQNYYSAIEYFDKGQAANLETQIASCYHDLAWILTYMQEYDRALAMFHSAIRQYDLTDSVSLATSYHALGSFYYLHLVDHDSAVYYLTRGIAIGEKLGYSIEKMAEVRLELSTAYFESGDLIKGDQMLQQMKSYPRDSLSAYSLAYIDYLDGLKLHYSGRYKEALEVFGPIHTWIHEASLDQSETGQNLLKQMIKTAESGGMFDQAYHYLAMLREVERATIFKDRQRTTKALEVQFETARKEGLIELQRSEIKQQRMVLYLISIGLLMILSLAVALLFVYRKVRQKNLKIETLMRELHHRVKNNLQIISSLLGLQSMKLEDEKAQRAVAEGKERIRAMSLIHQKLYQDEDITAVNIKNYIENLVGELCQSYGYNEKAKIEIDVPDISMDADTTLPLGLIINELVSNAFKYAFDDIAEPVLALSLVNQGNGNFRFSFSDNGKGLPEGFSIDQARSFGMKLINLLVKQLKGKLEIQSTSGLSYQIVFENQ